MGKRTLSELRAAQATGEMPDCDFSRPYKRLIDGHWTLMYRKLWEETNGPIPDGLMVCHTCDNNPCKNLDHLFLGNALDNVRDMVAKGRHRYGDATGRRHSPESRAKMSVAQRGKPKPNHPGNRINHPTGLRSVRKEMR